MYAGIHANTGSKGEGVTEKDRETDRQGECYGPVTVLGCTRLISYYDNKKLPSPACLRTSLNKPHTLELVKEPKRPGELAWSSLLGVMGLSSSPS